MPRVARKDFSTSFFHVMVQGINKEYIFNEEKLKDKYLELITKYEKEYNVEILAYCIMDNHVHLLIYTEDINQMSRYMHRVNSIYAGYYNYINTNRVGYVFRDRYVSEPIYKEEYLLRCIKYIHMNPVKAKMVKQCEDYKYSTYCDYLNNKGRAKSNILCKVLGISNYESAFKTIDNETIFQDIEDNRDEVISNKLKNFQKQYGKIEEVLKDKKLTKFLVKYLKNECEMTYVDIMKKFNITKGRMERLKKDDF